MMRWMRRLRGALGMGVTWAIAWAFGGIMIGVASTLLPWLPWELFFDVFDAPLPALAVPGFVGGAVFSMVLGVAGRNRRFDELSIPRFAFWGAVGGVLVGLIPAAMGLLGLARATDPNESMWLITTMISVPLALFSAVSASGTLALARMSEDRELLAAGEKLEDVGLSQSEARDLLGSGT